MLTGGTTVAAPAATVGPSIVDFGFVSSGESSASNVQVTNLGNVAIQIGDVTVEGSTSLFELNEWSSHEIPPGESSLITVTFTSDGGEHALGSLVVTIEGTPHDQYTVQLSGNTPGSPENSPPHVGLLSPDQPQIYYSYQQLVAEAEVFDVQQPDTGLYSTLDSTLMGAVEQETSDPELQLLTLTVDVYNDDISDLQLVDYPGIHSMTLCCHDEFAATSCVGFVASIDTPFSDDDSDGDGYDLAQGDCDEGDADVYPGALEEANGIDDDCDGDTNEDTELSDDDGDGASEADGDCDDGDPAVHPAAVEQPNYRDD
ncbi:MAG: MopE-related protein, partial [Myxococcota bacterium]|nr:MopE-related protein [Myxococcota bacterium]